MLLTGPFEPLFVAFASASELLHVKHDMVVSSAQGH
jgi:hypothetical protein